MQEKLLEVASRGLSSLFILFIHYRPQNPSSCACHQTLFHILKSCSSQLWCPSCSTCIDNPSRKMSITKVTLFSVYSGDIPKMLKQFFLTSFIFFLRFLLGSEEDSSGKFLETANLSCHQIWRKTCLLLRQSGYYLPLPVASLKNILTLQPSPQCPHGGSSCLVYTLKVCNSDIGLELDDFFCFFLLVCSTVHVLLSHKVSWLISGSSLKSSKKKEVQNLIEWFFWSHCMPWLICIYTFSGVYTSISLWNTRPNVSSGPKKKK